MSDFAWSPQLSAQPTTLPHPAHPAPRTAHSAPDANRRYSLPVQFLPTGLWSSNTSTVSLVESDSAARGEHILDETTVARRISALRQLNGANKTRYRYAKSTGARNSTFNQPVIVRTYPVVQRARAERRDLVTLRKEDGVYVRESTKMDLKMPPVEAFSFRGIMDEIRHGVTEDLERIAEICARSKYSLSNQYEVHMPPHGEGDPTLQSIGHGLGTQGNGGVSSLHTIGSDDELLRHSARGSRGGRRTKSVAYGTLETIMSSSKSSEEDKSKKKPAAVIAEEVRGRAAKKEPDTPPNQDSADNVVEADSSQPPDSKHVRSRSAAFATMIIDNAHGSKNDTTGYQISHTSLLSEPARPKTSTSDLDVLPARGELEPAVTSVGRSLVSRKPQPARHESNASTLVPESLAQKPSLLEGLGSWFSWSRRSFQPGNTAQERSRRPSHAEGSLRELLRSMDVDRKGKGIDRGR